MEVAFEVYGAVKSVKKQTFLFNQNIFNGTRLVDVAFSGVLPRFLMVDGYLCRLWYRGQPLVCNLCSALTRTSAQSVGKPGTLVGIVPLPGQQETLASSLQSAETSVSHDSPDSQLLKDNELDLLQSQSILPDLVALSGDSSDAEFNQRASKRVGKTRAHLPKRVILLQALLSKFVLQAAKSLTLLLLILLN